MAVAPDEGQRLNPFPHGWYVIEASDRVREGQLISKTWMGREIIVWRAEDGDVRVADATCPHLGAHLGPKSGGILRQGNIVCPFHGFEYDSSGKCVKATAGPPPAGARLALYEIREVNEFIFAYYDSDGKKSHWDVPDFSDGLPYARGITKCRVRSHPQITSENSVDFAHLTYLHGYGNLKQLRPTEIKGPFLNALYAFDRQMIARLLRQLTFRLEIEIDVCGLGVSTVRIRSTEDDIEVRQWVLATPVDGEMIDVWLAADLKRLPRILGLNLLGNPALRAIITRILVKELGKEVKLDAKIWTDMKYRPKPVLCQADRDIFRFRRYCEQFYPQSSSQELRVASL